MADQPKLIQTRTVNVIVDSNLFITRKLRIVYDNDGRL